MPSLVFAESLRPDILSNSRLVWLRAAKKNMPRHATDSELTSNSTKTAAYGNSRIVSPPIKAEKNTIFQILTGFITSVGAAKIVIDNNNLRLRPDQ
ncbi:hypothetical protein [uncultured Roseobacter sp.]|uniref:hypothetical protein n=1 Tax=uncultured Roseobacter sp. TaxID=114847 RepID=UPI002623E46F|nr:hypothetical protein [uncultured Roseobacter sp.]